VLNLSRLARFVALVALTVFALDAAAKARHAAASFQLAQTGAEASRCPLQRFGPFSYATVVIVAGSDATGASPGGGRRATGEVSESNDAGALPRVP
jgi:hypothetical protein